MDSAKIITVVIWAAVIYCFYAAFQKLAPSNKAVNPQDPSNPYGVTGVIGAGDLLAIDPYAPLPQFLQGAKAVLGSDIYNFNSTLDSLQLQFASPSPNYAPNIQG